MGRECPSQRCSTSSNEDATNFRIGPGVAWTKKGPNLSKGSKFEGTTGIGETSRD